jgi:predicted proteasome-type protease
LNISNDTTKKNSISLNVPLTLTLLKSFKHKFSSVRTVKSKTSDEYYYGWNKNHYTLNNI